MDEMKRSQPRKWGLGRFTFLGRFANCDGSRNPPWDHGICLVYQQSRSSRNATSQTISGTSFLTTTKGVRRAAYLYLWLEGLGGTTTKGIGSQEFSKSLACLNGFIAFR